MDLTEDGRTIVGSLCYMAGVPIVPTAWVRALCAMHDFNRRMILKGAFAIQEVWPASSVHYWARNALAAAAVGEWALFLDCDVIFPPDVLWHFLRAQEELRQAGYEPQVIAGIYHDRMPPFAPVVYRELAGARPPDTWPLDRPFQVEGAGAGCLWVQRDVFGRITTELKEQPFDPDLYPGVFGVQSRGGEDLAFFRRCQRLGVTVWAEPRLPLGHLREVEVTHASWQAAHRA